MRAAQGYIEQLGANKYRVYVSAGYNRRTGKRVRLTETVNGSRLDAEKVKTRLLVEAGESNAVREDMTIDEFFDTLYLPDCVDRLRERTCTGYRDDYDRFVRPVLGRRQIARLTPMEVNQWLMGIDGDKKRHKAYKMLHQLYTKAVRWDIARENVCKRVEVPDAGEYEPTILTADEAAEYLRAFVGTDIEPAVLIAIGGGLRRSEIAALDWGDVSPDGGVLVDNAITTSHGKAIEGKPKSKFSTRTVYMPPSVTERLNALRGADSAPLVVDSNGGRMHPETLSKRYRRVLGQLPEGVTRVPFKNLRHTSLSLLVNAGVDILVVSRRGGHSSIAITSKFYVRPDKSVDIAAAGALDKLL